MSRKHRRGSLLRAAGEVGPGPPDRTGQPDHKAEAGADPGSRDTSGVYEPGQAVRWKRPGGARWRYGRLGNDPIESDGGLRIYENHNGAARTLRPSQVQRLVRGPRGGQQWQPCEPEPTATAPSAMERLEQAVARTAAGPEGLSL